MTEEATQPPHAHDSNVFHQSERYITLSKTDRSTSYILYIHSFSSSFVPLPDLQLSLISLPSNLPWKSSRSKSKSKSNPNGLSSNAFSLSFSPNKINHHQWLPQDREFCECVQIGGPQVSDIPPGSHLKTFKHLEYSRVDTSFGPQLMHILIQLSCHIVSPYVHLDVGSDDI